MLRGKATLPLLNEPKHNYVGPAMTDEFTTPSAYAVHGLRAVGLFLGQKSKISIEQIAKEFGNY